jgi:hypothetical protein
MYRRTPSDINDESAMPVNSATLEMVLTREAPPTPPLHQPLSVEGLAGLYGIFT